MTELQEEVLRNNHLVVLVESSPTVEFEEFIFTLMNVLLTIKFPGRTYREDPRIWPAVQSVVRSCDGDRVALVAALMYLERALAYEVCGIRTHMTLAPFIATVSIACKMYGAKALHISDACLATGLPVTPSMVETCELRLLEALKFRMAIKPAKFYHFLGLAIKNSKFTPAELEACVVTGQAFEKLNVIVGKTPSEPLLSLNYDPYE